ncbi:MAG: hypothetical protein IJA84_04305 [Clostridia bacterium]|nr:hypothetical protein [Clostridia bacterium]
MQRKRRTVTLAPAHPGARVACAFMGLAAGIRLWHYLAEPLTAEIALVHLGLPLAAAICFLLGLLWAGGRFARPACTLSVVLGVTFFILKAQTFAPLHRALCTLLYLAVLVLFNLTLWGYLPTKKLLYPLFGLPLLYHIFVEDTQLYFFAQPPVPVWEWMPELSVLCIMAGLLSLSFAIKVE